MFCHFCGILGHDLKHCAAHYVVEKRRGHVEYQYGEFLKAIGNRPRASTSTNASHMSNTEEGNVNAAKQSPGQVVQGVLQEETAAKEKRSENLVG